MSMITRFRISRDMSQVLGANNWTSGVSGVTFDLGSGVLKGSNFRIPPLPDTGLGTVLGSSSESESESLSRFSCLFLVFTEVGLVLVISPSGSDSSSGSLSGGKTLTTGV